jgi:phosphoglycolate phosphatase
VLRAVVFDFDLTLADSSAGAVECVNHALAVLGLPCAAPERIVATIGLSLADTLRTLTGIDSPEIAARFLGHFVERADAVMAESTFVYEHVPPLLASLRRAGLSLGVVSTKYRYRIEKILGRDSLAGHFGVIVGGEDVTRHKPDPMGLTLAVERLGVRGDEALYVGDHPVDAQTARAAGIPFVAVLTGASTIDSFAPWKTRAVLRHVGDLPHLLGLDGATRMR